MTFMTLTPFGDFRIRRNTFFPKTIADQIALLLVELAQMMDIISACVCVFVCEWKLDPRLKHLVCTAQPHNHR